MRVDSKRWAAASAASSATSSLAPALVAGPAVSAPSALAIALLGTLALCVAMGMGRFAFTPLLPMMLRDGSISLAEGGWLAATNYLGYLLGAVTCAGLPWLWRRCTGHETPVARLAWAGLVATWLLLVVMALPWSALWPWARFLAGVASAVAFVFTTAWCMPRLALRDRARLAGLIYTGPGLGIVLSGLGISALAGLGGHGALGWSMLALAALPLLAWIRAVMRRDGVYERVHAAAHVGVSDTLQSASPTAPAARGDVSPAGTRWLVAWMVLGYGLAGFGYIITATFLPVMAREAMPGSAWVDLFWPMFGVAVIAGCLLATRLPQSWDNRVLLVVCYLVQSLGVVMSLWWPSVAGFALGSLLVGLPFTALTLFTINEIRLRWPRHTAALTALVTASYAIGQVLGPSLVNALLHRTVSHAQGFAWSLGVASGALLVGAAIWGGTLRFARARLVP